MNTPRFELGQTVMTRAALITCREKGISPAELITRHANLDQGDLSDSDHRLNLQALKGEDRIFSSYVYGDSKFFVITEWDRSSTCVMLAEDY